MKEDNKQLKPWNIYLFSEIPEGHYFNDNTHIWQVVKSNKVCADEPNYPRDILVMECVDIIELDKAKFKLGSWTRDFFNAKFQYIGEEKWEVQLFKYFLIRAHKKHLMETNTFKELEKWYEEFEQKVAREESKHEKST